MRKTVVVLTLACVTGNSNTASINICSGGMCLKISCVLLQRIAVGPLLYGTNLFLKLVVFVVTATIIFSKFKSYFAKCFAFLTEC